MRRIKIYRLLSQHRKLDEKRALDYARSKTAKTLIWISASFGILYIIGMTIMFSLIANDSDRVTPMEFLFGISPILFLLDFGIRVVSVDTPTQLVKPYVLLPLPRKACIDSLLLRITIEPGNLVWLAILIPYALMSLVFHNGILITLYGYLIFAILIIANIQWSTICKTLTTDHLLWWLLPVGVYALMALPIIVTLGSDEGFENFFNLFASIGTYVESGNILVLLGALLLAFALIQINRNIQFGHIYSELRKTGKTKLRTVSRLDSLNGLGTTGEYLKLEVKSIMRNKNPRKAFLSATAAVLIITILSIYASTPDDVVMSFYWCVYNYVIYSSNMISTIMGMEGNYIDCLMVHRENIYHLLRGKYLFFCAILLLPFTIMMLPVIFGDWSFLMVVSTLFYTAGFQYFTEFQTAIFNRTTYPLNEKFSARNVSNNSYLNMAIVMGGFLLPLLILFVLRTFFSLTMTYVILLLTGVLFTATYPIWLRNIYKRMMKRRYKNMEGFRASR